MKFLCVFALVLCMCAACSKNDNDNTTINYTDSYFMQQASYSNNAEISAGAIAASKGSYDSVRMFGSMMVADHGKAEFSLDSLASSLSITIPLTPDSAHQAMAAYLQTLSGHMFDTAYINAQVQDHMNTISLFQQELSDGNNQQIKDYANKNLPVIEMHLQEAQSIQQTIQ
jgi:putative membrane protein